MMTPIYSAFGFAAAGAVTFAMVHPSPIEGATAASLAAVAVTMGVLSMRGHSLTLAPLVSAIGFAVAGALALTVLHPWPVADATGFALGTLAIVMVHPWPIEDATGFALGALAIVMGVLAINAHPTVERPLDPDGRSGEDRELPF